MPRETRDLTVTVDGDERDATWKRGVGICVSGHDFGKGDTVEIDGTPLEILEVRRMMEAEAVTLMTRLNGPAGLHNYGYYLASGCPEV